MSTRNGWRTWTQYLTTTSFWHCRTANDSIYRLMCASCSRCRTWNMPHWQLLVVAVWSGSARTCLAWRWSTRTIWDVLNSVPLEGGDDEDVIAAMAQAAANSDLKLKRQMSASQPGTPSAVDGGSQFSDFPQQTTTKNPELTSALTDQRMVATHLRPFFTPDGLVTKCLHVASTKW